MSPMRPIFGLLDVIRLESSPAQVSLAVVLGAFLATSPVISPQTVAVILLLCVVRINILAALGSFAFFSIARLPFEDLCHQLGRVILVETPELRRLCAGLYHSPIFPFTEFNNTVVMGAFALFVVGALPLFVITHILYKKWGPRVWLRIQQTNAFMALRATFLFRRYAEHVQKTQ